jgi:Helix-turn-helix domain
MQQKSTSSTELSQAFRSGFPGQNERILSLLRFYGSWVPLPKILALGIPRYSARILELRRLGFQIENRLEYVNGTCRSSYRLLDTSNSKIAQRPKSTKVTTDWKDRPRLSGLPLFDSVVRK